jgi:hypothetical protein
VHALVTSATSVESSSKQARSAIASSRNFASMHRARSNNSVAQRSLERFAMHRFIEVVS